VSDSPVLQIIEAKNGYVVEFEEAVEEEENCYVFSDMKALLKFIEEYFAKKTK